MDRWKRLGKVRFYDKPPTSTKILKAALTQHLNKWLHLLHLDKWDADIIFSNHFCTSDEDNGASINPQWEYKRFTLRLYLPKIARDYEPEELEALVIHELCHCLVSGMPRHKEDSLKFEERTVSELTQIFLELDKKGLVDRKSTRKTL